MSRFGGPISISRFAVRTEDGDWYAGGVGGLFWTSDYSQVHLFKTEKEVRVFVDDIAPGNNAKVIEIQLIPLIPRIEE